MGPDGMERALVMTMDVVNSLGSRYDPGQKGVSRKQKREKKERVISGDSSSADELMLEAAGEGEDCPKQPGRGFTRPAEDMHLLSRCPGVVFRWIVEDLGTDGEL